MHPQPCLQTRIRNGQIEVRKANCRVEAFAADRARSLPEESLMGNIDDVHMPSSDFGMRAKFRNYRMQLFVDIGPNGSIDPLKLANEHRVVRFGQELVC